MQTIKRILWRIEFIFLYGWRMDPQMTLYTISPLARKDSNARLRLLKRRGVISWNEGDATIGINDFVLHYGKKAPITDVISIFLHEHPYVKRNFIDNPAFDFEGPYEKGAVTLEDGDVVIDAGANIGIFTLQASQKIGKQGHVYAFEPISEAKALLHKNLESNDLDNASIAPYALGDEVKKVSFSVDDGLLGSSTVFTKGTKTEEVEQTTLDTFVRDHNISKVTFLKADIEGAERSFLKGAKETIKHHKPKIAICIYHLPDDPEVIENLLRSYVPEYTFLKTDTKLFAYT